MIWYIDTGLLVKLYVPEPESAQVAALVNSAPAVVLSPLHRLEMTLALSAKQARGELAPAQTARAFARMAEDVAARRFRAPPCDWSAVLDLARTLGEKHGATTPARSLDVLHVAAARHLRAVSFVTTDKRQRVFALAAGLECPTAL
jgi:predicted nucleic acid-binding protein